MTRIQKELHEERHPEKRLFTSQEAFTLTKEDLLTIYELGEFQYVTPAEILAEWKVFKLLVEVGDNITDEKFIEMVNLVEDQRAYMQKSNEAMGRSLNISDMLVQNQMNWTENLTNKKLEARLSRKNEVELKELLQLPNRDIREGAQNELIRRKKIVQEQKNGTQIRSFMGTDSITYNITPEARGLGEIGA